MADADPLHPVNLLHHQFFGRIYHQPLLGLGSSHLGDLGGVAERRDGAVPEAGFRVAAHGVERELRSLARLIFVEVGEDGANEIAFGVMPDFLRDRDDANAGALELAAIMFEQIMIAEQAREAVDADLGYAGALAQGVLEKCLQAGPVIGRTGQTAVAVGIDEFDAALFVMCLEPFFLIIHADAALGLALGRHADIAECTFSSCFHHDQSLRKCSAGRLR